MIHLNYKIDKPKWRNLFYENLKFGEWHWSVPKKQDLYWYQIYITDDHPLKEYTREVEQDLNIEGMNNYPRFSYQFPNTRLKPHLDEDNMVSININLLDTTPIIYLERYPKSASGWSEPYEAAFINVGKIRHGVEPDPNPRLILKFAIRHPWDEVFFRLPDGMIM
tara:strand:+ start:339 stop:833 length:495 start_codon:yes stop_codon:yes gene_type:complete